jgi:hypothetical protein
MSIEGGSPHFHVRDEFHPAIIHVSHPDSEQTRALIGLRFIALGLAVWDSGSQRWKSLASWAIDYRWDYGHFWLSAQDCQVPNHNFSKPRTRTANSDFWGRLTHQLLGNWYPQFLICRLIYQKGKLWEVGFGDWQSMQDSLFWVCRWTSTFWGLLGGIFGLLESSATWWYQHVAPTQQFLFASWHL